MNGKLYIKKFIRDDGETLSFDAEEIYLSEDNTLLVRSDPATTAVDFTEADGGEMIRQRGAVYHQTVNGLIVPKTSDYWSLCTRLSRFFVFNHTYKIVYVKVNGSMFATNGAWISSGLQIVPVPHENYSYWNIEFAIGNIYWRQYAENSEGEQIYSNSITLPLITASMGGELWAADEVQTLSGEGSVFQIEGTSISATNTDVRLKGDTFQQTSPSPDYPQDVQVVAGEQTVKVTGKNMFDKSTIVTGPLQPDGTVGTGSTQYGTSDFIPITPNTTYYKSRTNSARFKYFSSDKTPLSSVYDDIANAGDAQSFTTPANAYYIRFTMLKTLADTVQIELGSTATDYKSYQSQEYTVNLGKNLFDVNSIVENTTATTNGVENHEVTYSSNNNRAVMLVKVKPNSSYVLSIGNTSVVDRIYIAGMKNTTLESGRSFGWNTSGAVLRTGDKDQYLLGVISVANNEGGNIANIINAFIQLELGSTITPYSPYFPPIELYKIGEYQDYIYKSGSDWCVHKEVGKLDVLSSGIVAFSAHSGSHVTVDYRDSSIARLSTAAITNVSNRFIGCTATQTWDGTVINGVSQATGGNYLQFSLPSSAGATQAEIRTYFDNHPTTVYYALATPTDTKITDATLIAQLNALAIVRAYSGTTVYSTSGTPLPAIFHIEMTQSVGEGEVWDNVGGVWEAGSGGVQTISVDSTQKIYPVWTVTGPCVNPVLQNNTTDTFASFDGTVAAGQTLTVYFEDGIAYLDSAIVTRYVSGYVSFLPGENMVGFNSDGGSTESSTISWDNIIN